ncbi:hypothetical protein BDR03DRAFT_938619, partial [Suillus americanus]
HTAGEAPCKTLVSVSALHGGISIRNESGFLERFASKWANQTVDNQIHLEILLLMLIYCHIFSCYYS